MRKNNKKEVREKNNDIFIENGKIYLTKEELGRQLEIIERINLTAKLNIHNIFSNEKCES